MMRKILLGCGIISSFLFIAGDIIAASQWDSYIFTDQAFSELTAVEAPTRSLTVVLIGIPYNVLVVAFAVGIWLCSGSVDKKRVVRLMATMILLHAVSGFVGGTIFPMHSRGFLEAAALTNTMHIVSTVIEVLSMLLAIGFGAATFGKGFRIYSIITIVLLLVGGGVSAMHAPQVEANLPTPGMGIVERVNIYGFMAWIVVLAITLIKVSKAAGTGKAIYS